MKNMGEYFKIEKYKPLKKYKPHKKVKEEIKDNFKTSANIISQIDISEELALRSALSRYVKSCIGEELSKSMSYCSIKGKTLFIVFDHPGSLYLYRAQEKTFLEKMRKYFRELKKEAPKAYWTKVQGIIKSDFKILSKPTIIQEEVIEMAKGDFKNHSKNKSLRKAFEEIRKLILFNQEKIKANAQGLKGEAVVVLNIDKKFKTPKNESFRKELENEFANRSSKLLLEGEK